MIFGEDGRALTCWTSAKKKSGRRYRYYISARDTKEYSGASGLPRIPAAELESVVEQIRGLLQTPSVRERIAAVTGKREDAMDEAQVAVALNQIDKVWDQLFPEEQARIIRLMVEKVVVSPDNVDVQLRATALSDLPWKSPMPTSRRMWHDKFFGKKFGPLCGPRSGESQGRGEQQRQWPPL